MLRISDMSLTIRLVLCIFRCIRMHFIQNKYRSDFSIFLSECKALACDFNIKFLFIYIGKNVQIQFLLCPARRAAHPKDRMMPDQAGAVAYGADRRDPLAFLRGI